MSNFVYQTVQVEGSAPFRGGPTVRETGWAAGAKLLQKSIVAINGWAITARINSEIQSRAKQIEAQMPPGGGVLLCVGLQEWERPDPTGAKARSFLSLHIVGGGQDPKALLQAYFKTPRLEAGAPTGWRRRDEFVWVTRL